MKIKHILLITGLVGLMSTQTIPAFGVPVETTNNAHSTKIVDTVVSVRSSVTTASRINSVKSVLSSSVHAPINGAQSVIAPDIAWPDDLRETVTAESRVPQTVVSRNDVRETVPEETTPVSRPTVAVADQNRQTIVNAALSMTGVPYVYGGASYSGMDCSGLTMLAYAAAGISLPHSSSAQAHGGTVISSADAQPGDLVAYSGHIAVYIGDGQMVEATVQGALSTISPVRAGGYFVRY